MRTTPLPQWRDVAVKFDECVRDVVFKMALQACISAKVGGLGIRVVDHAIGALSASWHESSRTCGESWTTPAPLDEHVVGFVGTCLLDLARVVGHAIGALNASWHESSRTCGESWTAPAPLAEDDEHVPQSVFSLLWIERFWIT